MDQAKNLHQKILGLKEDFTLKQALTILILISVALILGAYEFNTQPQSNLLLQNSTELNYTEDNKIGSLIVTDRSIIRSYTHPRYEACIHTSGNKTPIVLDIRTFETGSSSNTRNFDLLIDIPLEKIGERDFNQTLAIEKSERCRINSKPSITVKEK